MREIRGGAGDGAGAGGLTMMNYKCSGCGAKESFNGRLVAIAQGWALVDIATHERIKYVVLCPTCSRATDWLKKALKD